MRFVVRLGQHEGQLRAEPDADECVDADPGGDKDEQARRAYDAPESYGQSLQLAALNHLLNRRRQGHTYGDQ